jgi:ribosomal protein L31
MQNHSVNKVNVRLRKLTKDYGDFEIVQQEKKNVVTTDEETEQEYVVSTTLSPHITLSIIPILHSAYTPCILQRDIQSHYSN